MIRPFLSAASSCLIILWMTPVAWAGQLTLQDALRYALTHNAMIAAKQNSLAQAESTYIKQHSSEFPPVTASLQNQLARQNNASGNFAQFGLTPAARFSQNTAQIGTQWTLYNGSLNQILTQQNRRQVEAARADLRQTQAQITAAIVDDFFTIANKRAGARLAQSNFAYQQALLSAAQAKEKAGLVAGVDVLRADVAVQQAQVSVLNAQSDTETARELLAQEIGAPIDTQFAVRSQLPEPPLPSESVASLVRIAEVDRPDIAVAMANVAIAQLSRAGLDTDLRPQISINAAFGSQTSPTSFVDRQSQIDQLNALCKLFPSDINCIGAPFPNVVRGMPGFWQIGATSTLSFPIVDYGTRRAAHRSADQSIASAQLSLVAAQNAAEADIRQSLRSAQTTHAALFYQRKAVELAVESARIAQLQYRNGLISLTDAAAAQQTSQQVQNDLLSARIAYINAVVKLRIALGAFDPLSTVTDL